MEGGSVMKAKRQFTQKQKLAILESAKRIGIKKAAELAGVHYTSVYEWRQKLDVVGKYDRFVSSVQTYF
jgi:transposase-like protein